MINMLKTNNFNAYAGLKYGAKLQFDHGPQKLNITVQESVGSGLFSKVYRVKDEHNQEYALKAISLKHDKLLDTDRGPMMALVKRETSILKKLNMLHGFKKDENMAMLLIPYHKGPTVFNHLFNNQSRSMPSQSETEDKIKQCFHVLFETHRKGVVHNDAHLSNFIHVEGKEPQLIDYGLSQRKSKTNVLFDLYKFKLYDNKISNNRLNHKELTWMTLLQWYIDESVKYAKQNKIEFACKVMAYGAFTIACVYGVAYSASIQLMLWGLCQSFASDLFMDNAINELKTYQSNVYIEKLTPKLSFLNLQQNNDNQWETSLVIGHIIMAASLFWSLYRGYQAPMTLIKEMGSLLSQQSPASLTFWQQASTAFSAHDVLDTLSFAYFPLMRAYEYLALTFEYHFANESYLTNQCERIADSKGLFHAFGAVSDAHPDQQKAKSTFTAPSI